MTHLYAFDNSGAATLLDLYTDDSILLSFRFSDIEKLETTGGFSQQFRIPATQNNVAYFSAIFNPNNTGFDFHRKADAQLTVDTVPVTSGHIQVLNVYTRSGEFHEFELTFFAETPDLSTAVGEKKLSDIAALDALDHEVDFDEVTDTPGDRGFFLVDRGQRWSQEGQPGTRPVLNANFPPFPPDLSPAVRARYLFDAIMDEAGFTWEGWNNSTALADRLDAYYVPFVNDRFIQHDDDPNDTFFQLGLDSDITNITPTSGWGFGYYDPTLNEVFDNGNNVSAGVFTVPYTGQFQFKLWARLTRSSLYITTSRGWKLTLRRNGSLLYSSPTAWMDAGQIAINASATSPFELLNQGDTIEFRIELTAAFNQPFNLIGTTNYEVEGGTGWALISASWPYSGQDMIYRKNAPDYRQIDFVRDILRMHNCAVVPDRNVPNKLYIEPMTGYIATGASLDWTDKIDYSQDVVLSPTTNLQSKNLVFSYKQGNEFNSKLITKETGRVYGDYRVEGYTVSPASRPNDFARGENKMEVGIASTPCAAIPGTNIIIPMFTNESGEFTNPGVRLLFNSGTADIILYDDVTAGAPVTATVHLLNHYEATFPDVGDEDLNFAPEDPLYTGPVQTYFNLFNRFFRDYLNEIYDPGARLLEAPVRLNLTDITAFTFADRIFIKDAWWRVLEINGYKVGADDTCRVKFIKLIDPPLDCEYRPFTSGVNGVITFVDVDENTSAGSQICCERYGYVWSGGRCYASLPSVAPVPLSVQGTLGIGNSANSKNPPQTGNIIVAPGTDLSPGTTEAVIAGFGHKIEDGNPGVILAGDSLKILGAQGPGTAVFGKNAVAVHPGFHLGGGWQAEDRETTEGRAQFGVIMLSGEGDLTTNSTKIPITIEGGARHINIPDNTTWVIQVNVIMQQMSGTSVIGVMYGVFFARISKDAGIPKASNVDRASSAGNLGSQPVLHINIPGVDEHELSLSTSGSGHPYNDVLITASVMYTQVSHITGS